MAEHLRNDVVLESINGIHVLIALKSAWDDCPFMLQITPFTAYLWDTIQSGMTKEEIVKKGTLIFKYDKSLMEKKYSSFLHTARKMKYIIDEDKSDDQYA